MSSPGSRVRGLEGSKQAALQRGDGCRFRLVSTVLNLYKVERKGNNQYL